VSVEKQRVCVGEENLVTVRAHSPDGDNSFLQVAVNGVLGF